MKKEKIFHKLNKSSSFKLILVSAIIVVVEVLLGFMIYNIFYDNAYEENFAEYSHSITQIATDVQSQLGDETPDFDKDVQAVKNVKDILGDSSQFDNFVLFSESGGGRIIGSEWGLSGNLTDTYSIDYQKAQIVNINGVDYLFVAAKLGTSPYYVGGLSNFSAEQAVITSMLQNVVAILIVAGILVLCAFLFYALWAGGNRRYKKFWYRFTVNADGSVTHTNSKFKDEFYGLKQIKTDFSSFDKKIFNILKLKGVNGEQLLISKIITKPNGKTRVYASPVDNASIMIDADDGNELTANGKAKSSLSKAFEEFTKRGKRTLLGLINITNLGQISALFGKEMSLNIQKIVIKKVQEKFLYVYELDLGSIGVIYPDGKKLDNLMSDMEDVFRYITQPIHMEENLFTVELKAGFALCDASMQQLNFEYGMRAAEAALKRAQETNIADYIIYHESQKKLYTKYFITYDVHQMLSEGAFEMEYQPQYNISEGRIEGFEALFRVKKSWNVNVDTFSFITYAERTGAMLQLGDFIFDTGMAFAKKLEGKNVSVSLNVSPVQLMQAGFTENFLRLYKKYDLKPGSICVEITESFLMTNFQETLKKLEILKKNGITTHLDDFGTEYSSLLYIKTLPISTIKIDKEFVSDVIKNKESQAVIKFITNIAKLLNFTTICEGVETPDEFDMLKALGCDTIQGWLISKSLKVDAALNIVDTFDYNAVVAAYKAKNK